MPDLEYTPVDARNLDDIPDPEAPGAVCRACNYWEALDGSRQRFAGPAAREAKLRSLTAAARLSGSYGMLAYRRGPGGERTAIGYAQFGPVSAFPRAQAIRDRYPHLPDSPPPYVVTCLQVVPDAGAERDSVANGLLRELCAELDRRGVTAVEAYPENATEPWRVSAGPPSVYEAAGFAKVDGDARYPVYRIELTGEPDELAWPAELLRGPDSEGDSWPLPIPKAPDADAWPLPSKPRTRNPFGED